MTAIVAYVRFPHLGYSKKSIMRSVIGSYTDYMNGRKIRVRGFVGLMLAPGFLLVRWIERAHQRKCLSELEEHQLADIGISSEQRQQECTKWFWQ
ncbi:DUF1127 domain-containing protein [Bradyrhizobium sp. BR 10261]|uniref:DUF1127 domain-containing protein n=1 Tax=Bradyrhizobium sp. BR 10261 TaxID=2749992 RepID=UPI001C6471B7|nr:DUF1127 domain-containing protein [Bradyrhizobium sp. BR 10261]MBW7967353.1 DUF1127 domain-containing protein [Bradyrhizobium sp. BR 10261]